MHAHAQDLRAEVGDLSENEREALIAALLVDWRAADLDGTDRALCAYAEKLSLAPARMSAADVAGLRSVGLDDHRIHDAIQVISYFNYINRVADALHVEVEPGA